MSDQDEPKKEEAPQPPPKAVWEKRTFAINDKMRNICKLSMTATEAEISTLKRKLRKLQYGS